MLSRRTYHAPDPLQVAFLGSVYCLGVFYLSHLILTFNFVCSETKVEADLKFQKSFQDAKIVPDLIPEVPWHRLEVDFGNDSAECGNTFVVHVAWRKPWFISWPKEKGAFYTLMFIAPDHPDPENPRFRNYVLWLVVNVRDNDIENGDVLADYIMPPPPEKKGRQRYIFLAYKQKPTGKIRVKEPYVPPIPEDNDRSNLSIPMLSLRYDLNKTPAAGNFFFINWGVTI